MILLGISVEDLQKYEQEGYKIYVLANVVPYQLPTIDMLLCNVFGNEVMLWTPIIKEEADKKIRSIPLFRYAFAFLKKSPDDSGDPFEDSNRYWKFLRSGILYTKKVGEVRKQDRGVIPRPLPVSYEELVEMVKTLAVTERLTPTDIVIGDTVLIKEGPFKNFEGIVKAILHKKLKVEFSVFERQMEIELSPAVLERV